MRHAAAAGPYGRPFISDLTEEIVQHIIHNRDWDKERMLEMLTSPNRVEILNDPALAIVTNTDKKHMLCDGTHRILCRAAIGMKDFLFYEIPWEKRIEPDLSLFKTPRDDWGHFEIRDGKIYDRKTGEIRKARS